MDYFQEPEHTIPIVTKKDVVIAGGGPSGVLAAVAVARTGDSVLLIEADRTLCGKED